MTQAAETAAGFASELREAQAHHRTIIDQLAGDPDNRGLQEALATSRARLGSLEGMRDDVAAVAAEQERRRQEKADEERERARQASEEAAHQSFTSAFSIAREVDELLGAVADKLGEYEDLVAQGRGQLHAAGHPASGNGDFTLRRVAVVSLERVLGMNPHTDEPLCEQMCLEALDRLGLNVDVNDEGGNDHDE